MENEILNIKGFIKVIIKNKIPFIVSFLVIILACFLFTFLIGPQYCSISEIRIKEDNIIYKDILYKYFPAETDNLWIIPNAEKQEVRLNYLVSKLDPMVSEIKSGTLLEEIKKNTNYDGSISELARSIDPIVDRYAAKLIINIYSDNPEKSYLLNKDLLSTFLESKKLQFEPAFKSLVEKIDLKASELKNMVYDNSSVTEEEILAIKEDLNSLESLKNNLNENKDFYINRVEILRSPELFDVRDYSNYPRNIILSILSALAGSIFIAFIFNYFKKFKS